MTILLVSTILLTLISGVPGYFLNAGRSTSQRLATILHLSGCIAGVASAITAFSSEPFDVRIAWPLPGGFVAIHIDALSAFFLLPVFLVIGLGSLYGEGYWPEVENPGNGRKLRLFYGTLTAGLALVMIAGDAWSFLFGWEITGLSAFFLVITERNKDEALRAGWIYFIATHAATLILFAMFATIHAATGSWLFDASVVSNSAMVAPILILALAAFGIKAGLMPFHVWLPEAHAAAPSHVSAILSGIVLKMGVYGLIRVMTFVTPEKWFGLTLLLAGILSGVLGVVFALAQHDLKRLLAYHSIENIGIIFMGLGASVLGQDKTWGSLAFAGAVLHVWNHAFFKSLLFFAAGAVVHATGTRSIDQLGGLLPKLRSAGVSFLIGAVAISGLPPLNGFISEWLIYMGGFTAILPGNDSVESAAIMAVPALALIGALAVACFVKAFSVIFLGNPRSAAAENAHGEHLSMQITMGALALICVLIGVWPLSVHGALVQVMANVGLEYPAGAQLHSLFSKLPLASGLVLVLIAFVSVILWLLVKSASKTVTWDCGYAAPNNRMQYTASSFAGPLTALFAWAIRPETHKPDLRSVLPEQESFVSHVPDPVLDRFLVPNIFRARRLLEYAHRIQAGRIQIYILYIVVILLILLAWSST